jgi:hypothetical protein
MGKMDAIKDAFSELGVKLSIAAEKSGLFDTLKGFLSELGNSFGGLLTPGQPTEVNPKGEDEPFSDDEITKLTPELIQLRADKMKADLEKAKAKKQEAGF